MLVSRVLRTLVALGVCVFVAGACGVPPELEKSRHPRGLPSAPASGPVVEVPSAPAPWLTPTVPPTTGFAETVLVPCAGKPSAAAVITVLRNTGGLVPAAGTARVTSGPFCAGTWQISLVAIPDAEPMFVVTSGAPESLKLVTAGTNVCSPRVRGAAPSAVRAVACDEASLPTPAPTSSATPSNRFEI